MEDVACDNKKNHYTLSLYILRLVSSQEFWFKVPDVERQVASGSQEFDRTKRPNQCKFIHNANREVLEGYNECLMFLSELWTLLIASDMPW